ncbi:hypothetical protein [Sinimarinibacterium sp. NLF-5-8]|uniref:hypothetical protein n=1 Tax=Sinimarinibacterium sp. NLF-5-8 TaxID=2698684 RepID=UPI00137C395E|nr:hypothetical protein [Sinimarinibacterium sp. NLF-5-8]QHS08778.1 hypothetical protein GT972_00575 [Sinimarinibacterium sp. NLF-5-8]
MNNTAQKTRKCTISPLYHCGDGATTDKIRRRIDPARKRLSALPGISRAAARESVNQTARKISDIVRERTTAHLNLSSEVIGRYIKVEEAPEGQTRASVILTVSKLPLTEFGARVQPVSVPVHAFGRVAIVRRLAAVAVAIRRGHAVAPLGRYFPMQGNIKIPIQRKGKERLPTRTLTGVKTFSNKFLQKLRPELEQQARRNMALTFSDQFKTRAGRSSAGEV